MSGRVGMGRGRVHYQKRPRLRPTCRKAKQH